MSERMGFVAMSSIRSLSWLALAGSLLAAALPAQAQDAAAVLRKADQMRGGGAHMQIETEVVLQDAAGKPEKTRVYTVFARDPLNSLVLMRSPAEAGQKVLMSGDDFWMLMPDSQRPLRITPAQKLVGDASTGDIASLSWAESYAGQVVGQETCQVEAGAVPCLHLSLKATRPGVSYQRIELWVGTKHHEPLLADYHVQSDKRAKQATFVLDDAANPKAVTRIVLKDDLAKGRETVIRYTARKQRTTPEAWWNPMYLARNAALD